MLYTNSIYLPLSSAIIKEFSLTIFTDIVPIPIWSWIPENEMLNSDTVNYTK
jgi:hypothetical protein